ncbi:MAG: AAA family ATPase [Actinobacteria bacterium]|nr:AAA family ATPase [Actinomycetota bacterium]
MSEALPPARSPVPPLPTLEREHELARIHEVIELAAAGRGQLVLIEGPSGIGKSRLLAEARSAARAADLDVLFSRGGELEREFSFGVALRLLESRVARATPQEREQLLRGQASLAAPLLLGRDGDDAHAAAANEFVLVHGLYWCVVNLAEREPLALVVDDVHWADDLSLRFLNYLAQRLEDLPVVLFAAIRSGDPTAASDLVAQLSALSEQPPLRPGALSLEAAQRFLETTELPVGSRDALLRASWEATRGNPFLLHELAAAINADPSAWRSAEPGRIAAFAPQSLGRSVMLRLKRLGPEALKLARACAVLGDEVPLSWAAEIAGLDVPGAADAAERLAEADILASVDPVGFEHPMIRSAVYGEVPPGPRLRLHAAAARLLHRERETVDEVAHHLLAGSPTHDEWVMGALHAGARAAARKGAPATSVRFLRRALELCPPSERSGAMLIDLGLVEAAAGERTSLARFEQALAMLDEPAEQARALYALGQTLFRYGRHPEAAETFRRGADLFAERDRERALEFEAAFMCAAQYVGSMRPAAFARLEAMVEQIPEQRPRSAAERVLLAIVALLRTEAAPPVSPHVQLAREALGGSALLREQTSESMAANLAIIALLWCGHAEEALAAVEQVLSDARARGAVLAFAEASLVRAMVMHSLGRIPDAMADAQAAIEGTERGWRSTGPAPWALLADCLIERGDLAGAEEALRAVEPALEGTATRVLNAWFHWARGRLHAVRGAWEPALEDFRATGEVLLAYQVLNPLVTPWRSQTGLALHALGRHDEALAEIDAELTLARRFGLPVRFGVALRARGIVVDGPAGLATLRQAVDTLEDAGAPLELARALVDFGGAIRRSGQRVRAREILRRAQHLAHQCGATALQERAHDELLASGARPRRASTSGVEALTPAERRIAELAAEGLSNRGIAETLFLTKNTVEWHLRNVYRKLGVRSRERLGELMHAEAEPPDALPSPAALAHGR